MKPKLTPTTNDKVHGDPIHQSINPNVAKARQSQKIIAAHEPIGEPWVAPPISALQPFQYIEPEAAPAVEAPPLKVALIGTAPSSRMLAPYDDPSWKIWGCSPGNMNALPRVDAWFEIHGNMLWPENVHYGQGYLDWLNQQTFPIYMQSQKWVPKAISLPMRELVNEFGPYFFTSSFAWMMAFAMTQGAKEIALYGIDMASRDEYILQRPGAYYFFNEARHRGIKISAPHESDIMQPPALYGYSEMTLMGRKLLARKKEIMDRIVGLRNQRDSAATQVTYLEGALEDNDYTISIFGGAQSHTFPDNIG